MKAIDFRFRPNTPDAVDGLIHSPFFGDMCAFFNYPDRAWSASLDKIVEIMDEHEITGVITGRDVETTYGCPCSNMGVVEMMRAYPHKFYGMAGLDPHKGMQAIDELSRMVNEFGMKGASIDPYLAKLPADHRKFYPIYAKCCELKVPVVISTGPGTRVPGAIMGDASPVPPPLSLQRLSTLSNPCSPHSLFTLSAVSKNPFFLVRVRSDGLTEGTNLHRDRTGFNVTIVYPVRTAASHVAKRGSNPLGDASECKKATSQ